MTPDQLIKAAVAKTEEAMAKPKRESMNDFGYNVPRSVLHEEQEERDHRNREHMKRINGRLESWPMTGSKEVNDERPHETP